MIRLFPLLDLEYPQRVHHYRFDYDDRSLLQPSFDRLVIRPLLARLPAGLAPNALTLAGHTIWHLAFLWLLLGHEIGTGQTTAGSGPAWLAAVALAIYALTDSLDGQQARARGTETPLGDFYDHWLDALSGVTVPLAILAFCGPAPELAILVMIANALAWHANNVQRMAEQRLVIPPCGALEGALMAMLLMLATALDGPAFWAWEVAGWGTMEVAAGIAGMAYLAAAVLGYRRYSGIFNHPARGLVLDLAVLSVWALTIPLGGIEGILLALAIGLTGVRHVGHVLMHILIGLRLRPVAWPLTLFLTVAATAEIIGAPRVVMLWLVIVMLCLTLLYQFVIMTRFCCRSLDLKVWTVPRPVGHS